MIKIQFYFLENMHEKNFRIWLYAQNQNIYIYIYIYICFWNEEIFLKCFGLFLKF
jgi:hypothetical protein